MTYALYGNLSPGYGFTAVAVALLARLDALGVIATGIFFGALESGALAMQREAGVPAAVVWMVEAVLIVAALLTVSWRESVTMLRRRSTPSGGPPPKNEASLPPAERPHRTTAPDSGALPAVGTPRLLAPPVEGAS